MSNQLASDLRAARELIRDQNMWWGSSCGPINPRDKYCALQALSMVVGGNKVLDNDSEPRVTRTVVFMHGLIDDTRTLTEFNDSSSHAEVLDLFDRAIKAADQLIDLAMRSVQV